VAVHGLNGDAFKTWTTTESNKFWLGDFDLLPANLKQARILTFSYNASVTALFGKTSSDRILQHAHTLIAELIADREVKNSLSIRYFLVCGRLMGFGNSWKMQHIVRSYSFATR
jgi:protein SERAC1